MLLRSVEFAISESKSPGQNVERLETVGVLMSAQDQEQACEKGDTSRA
jgi:hypothetical protein